VIKVRGRQDCAEYKKFLGKGKSLAKCPDVFDMYFWPQDLFLLNVLRVVWE
jgi:hypothetical protein